MLVERVRNLFKKINKNRVFNYGIGIGATAVISNIDQLFFLVMGANIGTCSDGIMASLSTNANGKRIVSCNKRY